MSYLGPSIDVARPRLSRIALVGFLMVVASYPLAFAAFLMIGPCHPPTDWRGSAGTILGVLFLFSAGLGAILSIVGIVHVLASNRLRFGIGFSILGLAGTLVWIALLAKTFL